MSDNERYALIRNDTIVNLVGWDGKTPYTPDADEVVPWSSLPEGIQIGWVRDAEGNWSPPE